MNWPAALIAIVVASWLLYRFAAPKKWRDWARAGLVQAFIVSLYAEMFGFPLTIYLLTRVFGLDAAWLGQIQPLWATLLGLQGTAADQLMFFTMAIGNIFLFVGIGLLVEGWREVYQASQQGRLATNGLYGYMRHPQYTGIILAVFGEGVVHWPTVVSLVLFPIIVFAYVTLARKEEREMVEKYGDEYRDYQQRVPMFLPGFKPRRVQPASKHREKTGVR